MSLSQRLSFTSTNRSSLCDPVSIYKLQLLCGMQCVSANTFRGRKATNLSFFDLFFLSWHSAPSAWHNEECAVCSESPGSLSQHGGLPQKYAEASAENLPQNDDLFTL